MTIDTNKDEGFNEFMLAMGFVWHEKPNSAPATGEWRHPYLSLTIPSKMDAAAIVAAYTCAVEHRTAKAHMENTRNTLLDLMGLTVDDVRDRDGNFIVEDVVLLSRY